MSIYGKVWASSRGEAVERAVALGLLEPYRAWSRSRRLPTRRTPNPTASPRVLIGQEHEEAGPA